MGSWFNKEELLFLDEKKTAEVKSFQDISKQFAGGAVRQNELNFLPLLLQSSGVSGDAAFEIWGCVVGPGKASAEASGTLAEFRGNVLLGFLPYKGPTEKARMVMAFQQEPWLDCRIWASWQAFKRSNAGAASMPTGCLPMIWDENLKTPSGACHRISEWVAVDYFAAAKYGMMGQTAAELASILLLREFCDEGSEKSFDRFAISEAALRANSKPEMLIGETATLADIILFNALSRTYGNETFRKNSGPLFTACFPKLVSFYHAMLTQHPHLREYIFSDVHTPAQYFFPWTLQQPDAYKYAAVDNEAAHSPENPSVDTLPEADQATYSKISEQTRECELLFPFVRDEHLKSDFSTMYLLEALAGSSQVKDDLLWEFLQRVCKAMGVTNIKEHSGASLPADGPVLAWCREREMFIPPVYIAARKGKFPLNNASDGAKILQILSTVRQLLKTWMKDEASFSTDCCDKNKAGDIFSNVSPGNVLFLERLLGLNEWEEGNPLVGKAETLADNYVFHFMELVDERLLKHGEGLLSWDCWNEHFPLLSKFYRTMKKI